MLLVTLALMLMRKFWTGFSSLSSRLIAIYAGIGALVALHWLTFYASIKLSNASVAATCMALAPVLVAFVEPLLVGSRFDLRELFFGLAVIPGVALVVGGTPVEMRAGIAAGVLSVIFVAIFSALNKRFIEHAEPLSITGIEMAAGAVCLMLIAPLLPASEAVFVIPNRNDSLLLLILAMACTLLPYALSLVAMRHLSAFATSLAVNMEPVYAIVLAIIFFGEQRELDSAFYLGVTIILVVVFSHPILVREKAG
jgi:drug/metabolite transporter (DMT)-like permease